jgi:hypothetical protein
MKKLTGIALLLLPLFGWAQISFKGTAPHSVVVGEQFRVNYTLTTPEERGKDIRLPETGGLKELYGGTLSQQGRSQYSANGKTITQYTEVYTYILMAEKEGEYTIPPATIRVGNSEYKSNELKITALPKDQAVEAANANTQAAQQQADRENNSQLSGDNVFIRTIISKPSVYENEGFLVTYKLYTTVDVSFESAKFPEFEGFIAQEIDLPQDKQINLENYQGRNYRTVVIKQTILYPQRTGKITIAQGKFDLIAYVRTQSRWPRNFFDSYIDSYSNVKKTLNSPPATIQVKPLPEGGKPDNFTGAVGDYKITSSISATQLKANEPVTIKITLAGNGNIKLVKNPAINFPNDFEIYDPKTDVNLKVTPAGVSGSKTIEYYAVPRYAGDFVIPSVRFSCFNPNTGNYKTLSTEEYHLHVAPGSGDNSAPAVITGGTNKENVRFLGQDIRHIRTENIHFQKENFLYGSWSYRLCYLLPLLLFAILFAIYRKQAAENANIALVRTKKANKVAAKRLKAAYKYLNENQREAFYNETLKAVWGYLSDKLNIPIANLTKDNVETELIRYGVDSPLISAFINILNTAEFARFAPSGQQGAMDELYKQSVDAINQMEKI